ncbi:MAG: hypothetical protein IPO87_07725 [Flavobacteriales bacterium]|nr:hypothetical protein [Flavobacteriales bacterium]
MQPLRSWRTDCSVTLLNLDGGSTTPGATFSWSIANGFSSADEGVM